MSESDCDACHGARLKEEVLAVKVGDKNINQLTKSANTTLDKAGLLIDSSKTELTSLIAQSEDLIKNLNILTTNLNEIISDETLKNDVVQMFHQKEKNYSILINKLEALNPLLTLKRGYSIVKKENHVLESITQLKKDDFLEIEMKDGTIETKVERIKSSKKEG